jgi:hypothetical protein
MRLTPPDYRRLRILDLTVLEMAPLSSSVKLNHYGVIVSLQSISILDFVIFATRHSA